VAATVRHYFGVFTNFASQSNEALKIDGILMQVKNIHINVLTARKSLG
jgi:hypothetical protein